MTHSLRLVQVLGLLWVFLGPTAAFAAASRIEARSLAPVARDQPMEIWSSEDSEVSGTVATVIRERLREAGYAVAAKAAITLSFSVHMDEFGSDNQRRFAIEGRGTAKSGVQGDVSIRLGVEDSDRVKARQMTLQMILGRDGKAPLWTGLASGKLTGGDRQDLAQRLAHDLMDRFGQSTALPPELLQ